MTIPTNIKNWEYYPVIYRTGTYRVVKRSTSETVAEVEYLSRAIQLCLDLMCGFSASSIRDTYRCEACDIEYFKDEPCPEHN